MEGRGCSYSAGGREGAVDVEEADCVLDGALRERGDDAGGCCCHGGGGGSGDDWYAKGGWREVVVGDGQSLLHRKEDLRRG